MIAQRGTTTLAVLGLLAGFVDVDSFRMAPVPVVVSSSVPARAQASAVCRRKGSSAWRTAHRGLSMSSLSALDDLATEELGEKASRASVMDELDAILGDVQTVRAAVYGNSFIHRRALLTRVLFVIRSSDLNEVQQTLRVMLTCSIVTCCYWLGLPWLVVERNVATQAPHRTGGTLELRYAVSPALPCCA